MSLSNYNPKCAARYNRIIGCAGEFIPGEGCCIKHAILFDIWICEHEGYRIYRTDYPRNWKRSKFHKWLNQLGEKNAQKILNQ